ncbi:MAG: hypothetical protein U9R34_06960, partial [Nanoarchaeota archaeon]|nr:hypothetical protein [Nanoarchaeota archaeon]
MSNKKIVADLDDVLAKSVPAFLRWLSINLGKKVSIDDLLILSSEEFEKAYTVTKDWVLTDAQKEFFKDEKELENIESYNGNLRNIECVVITGREEYVRDVTSYWLKKHFKFDGNLYLTNWDNDQKVEKILQQKPQIYVDDNAKLLDKIKKCNYGISLYLVAQPWNKTSLRGIEDETGIVRINEIY